MEGDIESTSQGNILRDALMRNEEEPQNTGETNRIDEDTSEPHIEVATPNNQNNGNMQQIERGIHDIERMKLQAIYEYENRRNQQRLDLMRNTMVINDCVLLRREPLPEGEYLTERLKPPRGLADLEIFKEAERGHMGKDDKLWKDLLKGGGGCTHARHCCKACTKERILDVCGMLR
ncbi:hypothetical protein QAD02_002202 [Eretmocerus hayati]|uniref:Uncharacterized protein n=1 Tax=Eretmocerus hayati TaxID=131215 RepID=A0ACC2NIE1_9HYME|nr:hypothetical protein QAD02_002202 [Eretmocerus hayati]